MGRSFVFHCPKCEYAARVAGGEDRGLVCFVGTVVCRDCNELFDAVTRARLSRDWLSGRKWRFLDAGWMPRLVWQRTVSRAMETVTLDQVLFEHRDPRGPWVDFPLSCPKSRHHRIKPWKDPGRCPQCGVYLERTLVPYRQWE